MSTQKKTASSDGDKQHSILLIEDNHIAQKVACLNFEEYGCSVTIAETGKEALSAVYENDYDLIVVDIGLSDMNGYALAEAIRAVEKGANRHFTIIGLSAHIDTEHQKRCQEVKMDAVYNKPLTLLITRSILEKFLGLQVSN